MAIFESKMTVIRRCYILFFQLSDNQINMISNVTS